MSRYYIFDPVSNMWLDWRGQLAKFSGAKDYISLPAVLTAATFHPDCFIFELHSVPALNAPKAKRKKVTKWKPAVDPLDEKDNLGESPDC